MVRLILRHPALHDLAKPILFTAVTVSLVLNILAFQMVRTQSPELVQGSRAVVAQFAFLVPLVMILLMGRASTRCRSWEASLPIPARSLWWAHLGALSLAVQFLILVTSIAFLGFGFLISAFSGHPIIGIGALAGLVLRPMLVSLTATCLIGLWRPSQVLLSAASGWPRHRSVVILVACGLLAMAAVLPVYLAALPLLVVLVQVIRTSRGLPPALDMGGIRAHEGSEVGEPDIWTSSDPSPQVVRLMILRTLFKWPQSWIAMGPLVLLFALMVSDVGIMGLDEPYLRFINFFMVVYILFLMGNHFMENLYKVDHLPLDRRRLLRWLVLPVTGVFFAGYLSGQVIAKIHAEPAEEIVFENAEDNYGLKVPPEVWNFSVSSRPRIITAPWGESHRAASVPVLRGLPGILWSSFTTPVDASEEFVAWQICRAAGEVYGLDLEPEEIISRYLETDADGRTIVGPEGLTIRVDYSQAHALESGPVFPIWAGAEFSLLMLVYTFYFGTFKPGITIRKAKFVFWALMGGLMALHILGYVVFMKGLSQEWIVAGFWMGRFREIGGAGPGATAAVWTGAILVGALAYRLAEIKLMEAEAPPK